MRSIQESKSRFIVFTQKNGEMVLERSVETRECERWKEKVKSSRVLGRIGHH